jgi:hypothetical protein
VRSPGRALSDAVGLGIAASRFPRFGYPTSLRQLLMKSISEREDIGMAVARDVAAARQRVWDVLADGWTYSGWVVGNSRIRAVSSNWPAPGSRILHSIGAWPAAINDETVVESCVSGEELVLLAKVRPAAEARITMRLSDIPGGCRVEMTEVAVSRPLRWVPDSVQLTGVAPRNRECTWRLAMIAEKQDPGAAE